MGFTNARMGRGQSQVLTQSSALPDFPFRRQSVHHRVNLFFHSPFFVHHFPDDARHRTAPLAWEIGPRPVRAVLGIARNADCLRGNGARRIAQAGRDHPRARREFAFALRPLADGRLSKTGASLAQRARPRHASRPRQPRPLPVSVLVQPDAAAAFFSSGDFRPRLVGHPVSVQPERRPQTARRDAARRNAPAGNAAVLPHQPLAARVLAGVRRRFNRHPANF